MIASLDMIPGEQSSYRTNASPNVDRRTDSVPTIQVLIHLWDAEKSVLKSIEFFKVTDATCNRFSPNGHFLAVGKRSEKIIE